MWDDDQDLRDALRTELIEWTPPPLNGGLAEVLRLGRRRRRTQQASLALALVAAIAGTAFMVTTLASPNALPPADSAPQCSIPDTSQRNVDTVRAGADVQKRVTDALHAVADRATVGELTELHTPPNRPGTVDAYVYTADITDVDGTGSVRFSIGTFVGAPPDEQAFDEFNCEPRKRHVLSDGTVLRIYPTMPSEPFVSLTRILRIYRPDGTLYTLEVHNFGSPDFAPNPEVPERVGAGRETLPLTEIQLADLGLAIAKD